MVVISAVADLVFSHGVVALAKWLPAGSGQVGLVLVGRISVSPLSIVLLMMTYF